MSINTGFRVSGQGHLGVLTLSESFYVRFSVHMLTFHASTFCMLAHRVHFYIIVHGEIQAEHPHLQGQWGQK